MSAYIAYARLIKGAKLVAAIGFAKRHGIGGDSAPVYLDVGARGGLPPAWSVAARLGLVRPILVEADPTEADRLSDVYQTATVIPYALGSQREVRDLYLTATPGRSSLLMPDPEIVSTLHPTAWAIESIERVETVRLDEIWNRYASDEPSFVKIDTQGFEKEILVGMGAILSDVSCIELESSFQPFYVGQPKFQELFEFLSDLGFDLVRIKPHGLYYGCIWEFNAFMIRRGRHNQPEVKFWKKMNDVGSHTRMVTFGY